MERIREGWKFWVLIYCCSDVQGPPGCSRTEEVEALRSRSDLCFLDEDHLLREKAQQHDGTYYMWALAFFMAFNRAAPSGQAWFLRPSVSASSTSLSRTSPTTMMMLTDRKEAALLGTPVSGQRTGVRVGILARLEIECLNSGWCFLPYFRLQVVRLGSKMG